MPNQINQARNYQIIDDEGKILKDNLPYDQIRGFKHHYAAVKKGKLWGFIDEYGNEIVKTQYDDVQDVDNYFCSIVTKDGNMGAINVMSNEIVLDAIYSNISNDENFHYVKRKSKNENILRGIADVKFNVRVPVEYYSLYPICEKYFVLQKQTGEFGMIGSDFTEILPCKYEFIRVFDKEYLLIGANSQRGLFSIKENRIIVDPMFSDIDYFSDGIAIVSKVDDEGNAKFGFIKKGEKTSELYSLNGETFDFNKYIEPKYSSISSFSKIGIALVKMGEDEYGYIDRSGKEIVSSIFTKKKAKKLLMKYLNEEIK